MCLSVLGNLTNACLILDACLIIEVATETGFTVLLSQFVCVWGGGRVGVRAKTAAELLVHKYC